ncbi:LAFA_0D00254g1_1 [Lachancea sp. 'fantastica']|nr:LAFA_0D00254g1_1 [Lachancea sp. 'fantastica']
MANSSRMAALASNEKEPAKESTIPLDIEVSSENVIQNADNADGTLAFLEEHDHEFSDAKIADEDYSNIVKKVNWNLMPLLIAITTLMFMDKTVLSYASIMGLFKSTNLTDSLYDDLNSIFYTGYTIGSFMNLILQRYNLKKFLNVIIFTWGAIVFLHAAAFNFGGLVVLRFFLGFFESVIIPLLEVTMAQFYTPKDRATMQPIFWTGCVGFPVVISGFIAYGCLHVKNSIPPWRIFMIINGGVTVIMNVVCVIWYPSDPSDAHFLTTKEKYFLIKRVQKESKASITQSTVKKYQIVECLKDPISWLFTLFCFSLMLSNNLTYQQNLLYVSLGVSDLGSTLVSLAGGGFSALFALFGAGLIHYFPNNTFWMCLLGCLPSIAGGIGMVAISWENKLALLAMLVLSANTYFLAYISGFGWSTSSCAGQTKRFVRHFMYSVAYGVSNIVSPQIWKGNQGTRYYAAWIVQIVLSWLLAPVVAGIITYILKARNQQRQQYISQHPDALTGEVVKIDADTGEQIVEKVDIGLLDLTDLENKAFIYPL